MTTLRPDGRRPQPRRRRISRDSPRLPRVLAGALASAAIGAGFLGAAPASAALAQVSVSSRVLSATGTSTISVSGTGFQSIKNGFGGIYVLFGYASANWRPSQGAVSGSDLVYVQDSETKVNSGYQRFVAFPGSATAEEANGGVITASGTWQTTLKVPGPSFPAIGPDGSSRTIDCRTVRCGVITIGAHGVKNAQNETFTPITFATPAAPPPAKTTTPAARTTAAAPNSAPVTGRTTTRPAAPSAAHNSMTTAGAQGGTSARATPTTSAAKPSSGAPKASSTSAHVVALGTDAPAGSASARMDSGENAQPVSATHDTSSDSDGRGWWIGLVSGLVAAIAAATAFWVRRRPLRKRS